MDRIALFSSFLIISSLFASSNAQICGNGTFTNNTQYTTCNSLPVLSSFLHWNYHQSNNTVDLAYRHTGVTTSQWVVWALNPDGGAMRGAQCLVAFTDTSGSIRAYTSPIPSNDYGTQLQQAALSFNVPRISAEFNGNEMTIYATIELPNGRTSFSQVWQHGDLSGNIPTPHPFDSVHLSSYNTIDFSTGQSVDTGAAIESSRRRKENVHGVLNVVSWGILMPIGAMTARYLKVFKSGNPAWFYLHVTCQASAYIVGVAGWGTGLKLGSDSPGVEESVHRKIGITLFVLGTLQVFALLLRPKPEHKYRFYWNIYHIGIGYSVIILSIVNIFEGFDILDPEKKWKKAYIGVLIFIGANAAILEAFTWYIVLKRKSNSNSDKHAQIVNGTNGNTGYGA